MAAIPIMILQAIKISSYKKNEWTSEASRAGRLEGYLETYMYKKRRFVNLLLTKVRKFHHHIPKGYGQYVVNVRRWVGVKEHLYLTGTEK